MEFVEYQALILREKMSASPTVTSEIEAAVTSNIDPALEMIALGMIILCAHIGGKICRKLRLTEVTGQILGGAISGSYFLEKFGILDLIGAKEEAYGSAIDAFHFFVFVFLSMVAFGIGEELHISRLKHVGKNALIVTLIQGALTWFLITTSFYFTTRSGWLGLEPMTLKTCLLIGSIGIASAPAVTFVLLNQLRIEGKLRHVLGSVIVLADLLEVIIFSVLIQLCLRERIPVNFPGETGTAFILPAAKEIGIALLLAVGIYILLRILVRRDPTSLEEQVQDDTPDVAFLHRILSEHPSPSAEILLVAMGTISLGAGIAYYNHLPFLITAIAAGFLIANFHSHAIFNSLKIENITAILNLGFFALIGAHLSFGELGAGQALLAGIYILSRLSGKLFGVWAGCVLVGEERKITACLPSLLLPQAGVGAVEAVFASAVLGMPEIAAIVLPAIVVFEVGGVLIVDRTLRKWRSWVSDEETALRGKQGTNAVSEAASTLLSFMSVDLICLNLKSDNKADTLEEMIDFAQGVGSQHIDRTQALQVLGEREKLAPTGFGNGIAIPHCRLMGLNKAAIIFGRHDEGVVFGGVDNSPCHLILMILSCPRDPGEHLQLLSATAHVLGREDVRQKLRDAKTPPEFIGILKDVQSGKL